MKKIFKQLMLFIQLIKIKVFFKCGYYNLNADREYNDELIKKNSLDKNNMINVLNLYNYDFYDPKLSFHYSLFAGLSKNKNNKKILEIGTNLGKFTNFVSNIFPLSIIYTCDLDSDDELFDKNFSKEAKSSRENFLRQRNVNLKNKNIIFKTLNSFDLLKNFEKDYFDIIWVDGDHFNPQVTMDVVSAYYLLKKDGKLICDDIFIDEKRQYINESEGFEPINYLTKINKIQTTYFLKRITKYNFIKKKYISLSVKI